jgi:hypothetical protein
MLHLQAQRKKGPMKKYLEIIAAASGLPAEELREVIEVLSRLVERRTSGDFMLQGSSRDKRTEQPEPKL